VITAVLVLAVALLGWRLLVLRQAGSPATTAATTPARAQASSKIPEPPAYGVASHASAFNPPVDILVVLPFANLGDSTLSLKDALPKVREEANKALQLDPGNVDAMLALASANMSIGKNADARQGFRRVAGKLAYQSVLDSRLRPQALASADALRKRSDLGPDSLYNLFMVYLVLDKKDVALDLLDRSCAPAPYSCGDFAINPTYIPLRGDPRFVALAKKYAPPSPSLESASSSP
jgi:hypothetical protein